MEIYYKTPDNSIRIKLVYSIGRELKQYAGIGKSYPPQTQCLFFVNGFLRGCGTVVKHEKDKNNQNFAFKLATKKALADFKCKWIRKEIWKIVIDKINEPPVALFAIMDTSGSMSPSF